MNKISKLGEFKVEFNLNDVVNVFLSRYEKSLLLKKSEINSQLGIHKKNLDIKIESVENSLNSQLKSKFKEEFDYSIPNKLFKCKFDEGQLNRDWKEGISARLCFESLNDKGHYNSSMSIYKSLPPSKEELDGLNRLKDLISQTKTELGEVMVELSQISSKEREIRGLISEKNLRELGMEDMLLDNDILKLIELK